MKLFTIITVALIVIASSFGVNAEESTANQGPITSLNDLISESRRSDRNGRFFFNFEPCSSLFANLFNLRDAKCSKLCILFGSQNGGYCDENNECQCNEITITN